MASEQHDRKPLHVAIIMDRNGEWAKRRMLSRVMGHTEGVKAIKRIVKAAGNLEIDVLTLFAFSTENWLRPKDEVSFLMKLLEEYILSEGRELINGRVKVIVSGRLDRIPASAKKAVESILEQSKNNTKLTLNIALDYGARDELVSAAAKIAEAVSKGEIQIKDINETLFRNHLYHPELPDIDLLIRTGQEKRVSNFMLWQIAYAELYFTPVLWPDFTKEDLMTALDDFAGRQRRFGMTGEQVEKS